MNIRIFKLFAVPAMFVVTIGIAEDALVQPLAEQAPLPPKDAVLLQLEDAFSSYKNSSSDARDIVLRALDSSLAIAQARGDLDALKALQSERDAFSSSGTLPTLVSIRIYQRRTALAKRNLESAYESAVRELTQNGDIPTAEVIQQEFEAFKKSGSLRESAINLLDGDHLNAWDLSFKLSKHWSPRNGILRFDGQGGEEANLSTKRSYKNFTFRCEWRIGPGGDSGIFLRGIPQVQIWDHIHGLGQGIGSGGLYNNKRFPKHPTEIADNPIGQWNSTTVTIIGDKVTVTLNGKCVVNGITMENHPNHRVPLPAEGPIVLQAFRSPIEFRHLTILELP
ncbi:hypothetical protein CA13_69150 [Planctomycetes bacterium CA13]|uniref:3-keto-alpha-glucoside-1,2-lyase/3-keto-2-hydroxy-glucal hydratase domain-containing protein n=1 Tax=Novipirellula herctigrandis TaxID=2527986 RepID=A0A5C5YNB2_9BACT|nr:hypothetical protein CA13_69150 [Planctomycetes bacterium CA13]